MKRGMTVVDLFCGAGGLSTGFRRAGFQTVLGIDKDKKAVETFIANHPESRAIQGDMTQIKGSEILKEAGVNKIDVIVGGPPCQGFSMAGKRRPNDPRNSLFREYLRLVNELRPRAFIMENVKGLLSMRNHQNEKVIDIILKEFRKMKEYDVQLFPVNTADYGVPQKRQRIFIVGIRRGYTFTFPLKTHSKDPSETGLKKWAPLKSVVLEKEKVPAKYFYSDKLIKGFRRRERENEKRGLGFGWQFNDLESPSYTISARYWKDGAESLIAYKDKKIRMLTPKECAAVQSFPRGYNFKGSERDVYIQIGNAVPPLMAERIAGSLKEALSA